MTVQELYEPFINDCKLNGLARGTVNEHAGMFKRIIIPALGDMELSELLPIHVNEITRFAARCGKSAHRHAIITFRRLIRFARKNRWPLGIDVEEIEIPTYRQQKDVCAWSKNDIARIREILSRDYSDGFNKHCSSQQINSHRYMMKRTACLFEVLLHSGMRLSEALSVDIKKINWETAELTVEDCKEPGKWKTVYLHGALDAIRGYLAIRNDSNPALFVSSTGRRLCYDTAQSSLAKIKQRLKKNDENIGVFDHKTCRSTFITIPLRQGVDPKIVQNLAHHASLHMTLNYYYKVDKEKVKPIHQEIFSAV